MDRFVALFEATPDADLMLCARQGVAYQADRRRVDYADSYLSKFAAYDARIAEAVNRGRCELVTRHLAPGGTVLDYGSGDGRFLRAAIKAGFRARGFDVIPAAVSALREAGLYADDPSGFDAVCLWDTIEHMEDPGVVLGTVRDGALLFVSLPIFDDLASVRASKHYRPGEHLYYWTASGFIDWMALHGFRPIEYSAHETEAGRESIGAFAFRRRLTA